MTSAAVAANLRADVPLVAGDRQNEARTSSGKLLVNLSVDVEALPGRAPKDHIDRLIYGRFGRHEYGLPLHMRLYRELGVPATFYLEYGACALYGDDPVVEVGKRIAGEGFDLQLHVHPEVYLRAGGRAWNRPGTPGFGRLTESLAREVFEFALERYHYTVGRMPDCFRAGSFQFNSDTVKVGGDLGIPAFSNYRVDQRGGNTFEFSENLPLKPFQWSNGVIEFPITLCPEPLGYYSPSECWRRVLEHADIGGNWLANVVIHSWSFTHRNADGYHEFRDLTLIRSLLAFIEEAPPEVEFVSISDVLGRTESGQLKLGPVKDPQDLALRPDAA